MKFNSLTDMADHLNPPPPPPPTQPPNGDLIYCGEDYDLATKVMEACRAKFPGAPLEEEHDGIHGWRVAITFKEPVDYNAYVDFLRRNLWCSISLWFGVEMYHNPKALSGALKVSKAREKAS